MSKDKDFTIQTIEAIVASSTDEIQKIRGGRDSYYASDLIPEGLRESIENLIEENFHLQDEFGDFDQYAELMRRNYAARMRLFFTLGLNSGFQTELNEFHASEFPGKGMAAMTVNGSLILASPETFVQSGRLVGLVKKGGGRVDYLRLPFRPDPSVEDRSGQMSRVVGVPTLGFSLTLEGRDKPFDISSPLIAIAAGTDLQNFGSQIRQGTQILEKRT